MTAPGTAAVASPPVGDLVAPYTPRPGTIPTLPVPDPSGWRTLHLVGIGGAGMRNVARLLLARGVEVTGSDLKDSQALDDLRARGATIFIGHREGQVGQPDGVVISTAVPMSNPEVRRAASLGVPILARAQVLTALTRGSTLVAVGGTHGKTTTTSMISVIASRVGLAPTYVIGGDLNESGSGAEHGDGDVFVVEADESDGSFLLLEPAIAVITNVEADHLNFYRDATEVEAAFRAFAGRAGSLVAYWDDPGVRRSLAGYGGPLVRYGEGLDVDVRVRDTVLEAAAATAVFDVDGAPVEVRLNVPGRHNVLNAAASLAVARLLGVDATSAVAALEGFGGVRRRFEIRGRANGAVYVDDYAHHPTEIVTALDIAAGVRTKDPSVRRVIAVCQPHRYSRMQAMWRETGESLTSADVAVVTDIYGAHEQPIPGLTGKLVVHALADAAPGKRIVYLPRRSDVAPFLAAEAGDGDLVVTLGCGDIGGVIEETFRAVEERQGPGAAVERRR
jgi:UDP-N-acetylmuramate--alanine ligase